MPSLYAKSISCTHPSICEHLKNFIKKNQLNFEVQLLTTQTELEKATLLLYSPHDLKAEDWQVIKNREQAQLESHQLYLSSKHTKFYKVSGSTPIEIISHYWLYPNLQCDMEKQFSNILKLDYPADCLNYEIELTKLYHQLKKQQIEKITLPKNEMKLIFTAKLFKIDINDSNAIVFKDKNNHIKKTISLSSIQFLNGIELLKTIQKGLSDES